MNFDVLAPHYRWMEAVLAGSVLQRARTRWLGELSGRRNLLIVGEGPGRALEVVCREFPALSVTVVEASAGMIAAAKQRLERKRIFLERVTWVQADVRTWLEKRAVLSGIERGRPFDAVLMPFVLDCFTPEDVSLVIMGITREAGTDAVWLVADFRVPERSWRRLRGKLVHAWMYLFFRTATRLDAQKLTPPDEGLRAAGFELERRALFNAGLVHSDVWTKKAPRVGGAV